MKTTEFNKEIFGKLYRSLPDSHKGQNGRLLVIGGSELFHASIFWSAQVASKIVDLVHFTSPANENNDLVRQKIKAKFWEGIVVDFSGVEEYIKEDDCILIGPGMTRTDGARTQSSKLKTQNLDTATEINNTKAIVNDLLKKYPEKRWVVDGGALQEVDPDLLNGNIIITPHQGEWAGLVAKTQSSPLRQGFEGQAELKTLEITEFSLSHKNVTILLKGQRDLVCRGDEVVEVAGGNPGMTKGGTGDVLAGLVAALYCKNEAYISGQIASYVNKKAGEELAKKVGHYFNAGDLVGQAPKELFNLGRAD